jgi:hypothetical protein
MAKFDRLYSKHKCFQQTKPALTRAADKDSVTTGDCTRTLYNVSMRNSEVDRDILEMSLVGYQAELEKVEGKISEIRGLLNGGVVKRQYTKRADVETSAPVPAVDEAAPVRKRRKMSAAGRKRIGDATRARWAGARAAKNSTLKKTKSKKRLKLSAEDRARISGGQAKTRGKNSDVPF